MKTGKIRTLLACLFACLMLFNYAYSSDDVMLTLSSDKEEYSVGEEINLFLSVNNSYDSDISGQIKGSVVIGDVGYEIQCFETSFPQSQVSDLGLGVISAGFSNSNTKKMQTLYACSGTQMRSTRTYTDSSQLVSTGKDSEVFTISPFSFSYVYNGSEYEVKSNSLNVTVVKSEEQKQEEEQQSQQQQEQEQNPASQNSQTQQSSSNNQNPSQNPSQSEQQSLSQQNQNALQNNQQNAQSVNDLKKQIENDKKNNPLVPEVLEEKDEKSWLGFWLLILVFAVLGGVFVYLKYFGKEEVVLEQEVSKKVVPKYLKLLRKVGNEKNDKEKAKLLSRAVREYLIEKKDLKEDLTNIEAKKHTSNSLFLDVLDKANLVEFSSKFVKRLDYDSLVKKLRKEFK